MKKTVSRYLVVSLIALASFISYTYLACPASHTTSETVTYYDSSFDEPAQEKEEINLPEVEIINNIINLGSRLYKLK